MKPIISCTFFDLETIANYLKTNKFAAIVETDTVMGIISLNANLIYECKNRPREKQLILFISNLNEIHDLNEIEKRVLKEYWPGKLTIIKNKKSYRIPNHKQLLKLISLTGPIYSSSANLSGAEPVNDINEAKKVFSEQSQKIIFVDGKKLSTNPSTIIDLDNFKVIRNGIIDGNEVLNKIKEGK